MNVYVVEERDSRTGRKSLARWTTGHFVVVDSMEKATGAAKCIARQNRHDPWLSYLAKPADVIIGTVPVRSCATCSRTARVLECLLCRATRLSRWQSVEERP